jgi:hypothetical protein
MYARTVEIDSKALARMWRVLPASLKMYQNPDNQPDFLDIYF